MAPLPVNYPLPLEGEGQGGGENFARDIFEVKASDHPDTVLHHRGGLR